MTLGHYKPVAPREKHVKNLHQQGFQNSDDFEGIYEEYSDGFMVSPKVFVYMYQGLCLVLRTIQRHSSQGLILVAQQCVLNSYKKV